MIGFWSNCCCSTVPLSWVGVDTRYEPYEKYRHLWFSVGDMSTVYGLRRRILCRWSEDNEDGSLVYRSLPQGDGSTMTVILEPDLEVIHTFQQTGLTAIPTPQFDFPYLRQREIRSIAYTCAPDDTKSFLLQSTADVYVPALGFRQTSYTVYGTGTVITEPTCHAYYSRIHPRGEPPATVTWNGFNDVLTVRSFDIYRDDYHVPAIRADKTTTSPLSVLSRLFHSVIWAPNPFAVSTAVFGSRDINDVANTVGVPQSDQLDGNGMTEYDCAGTYGPSRPIWGTLADTGISLDGPGRFRRLYVSTCPLGPRQDDVPDSPFEDEAVFTRDRVPTVQQGGYTEP